jgi:mannose-6-phosphate isomerase-like protein (cupin superfamily)
VSELTTNIGTELLFENDRVRVWEMILQPGEESPLHMHEGDYVFVYVTPENKIKAFVEGKEGPESEFADGFVQYTEVGPGTWHKIRNVGDKVHRQILFELKGPSRSDRFTPPETNGRVVGKIHQPGATPD